MCRLFAGIGLVVFRIQVSLGLLVVCASRDHDEREIPSEKAVELRKRRSGLTLKNGHSDSAPQTCRNCCMQHLSLKHFVLKAKVLNLYRLTVRASRGIFILR